MEGQTEDQAKDRADDRARNRAEGRGQARAAGDPRAPLPAVYESPWRLLGRDLRAVAASLRLGLQERWRRQPWLVALLALALVVASVALLQLIWPRPHGPERHPPQWDRPPVAAPAPAAPATAAGPSSAAASADLGKPELPKPDLTKPDLPVVGLPIEDLPVGDLPVEGLQLEGLPGREADRLGGAQPEVAAQAPSPAATSADPLLQALAAGRPADLLRAVSPRPAEGRLRLELAPALWAALTANQRQALACGWQEQAGELGYEQLELADGRGGRLGQTARVGSGMILLEPLPLR